MPAVTRRARGSRAGSHRIGLALAGGGPAGAVYELGALRALEEVLEGIDFNQLDVYVGVSAGALVAASLANGIPLATLVRTLLSPEAERDAPGPSTFYSPAYGEWLKRAAMLPFLLGDAAWRVARRPRPRTLASAVAGLARAIPVALFDNEPLRQYLARTFSREGRTDDFRELAHTLIVVATDIDAGQAITFGRSGWDHVPISRAVQASTALPMLYPPVRVDGHNCVDGVLLRTMHASLALDEGVDLLLAVNPIVPVDTAAGVRRGLMRPDVLVRGGLPSILSQTFRTLVHSRMEVGLKTYETRYPTSDVIVFEPARDEYEMFFSNIFSLRTRRAVCELAYRATRDDLRRRSAELIPKLARRGIRLRTDLLDDRGRDLSQSISAA